MVDPDRHEPVASIPGSALRTLHRALSHEAGPELAARAVQAAGAATGDLLFESLTSPEAAGVEAEDLRRLPLEEFWDDILEFLSDLGWGSLEHEAIHPGIGALSAPDWIEADPAQSTSGPRCFFASGLLSGLLGGVAGRPIAVLEVECRSAGDDRCRFLFGDEAVLGRVRAGLEAGRELSSTLELLS